jgi:hypothetical protein
MRKSPALTPILPTASRYKWLFLAPVGLVILPILVGSLFIFFSGANPFRWLAYDRIANDPDWWLYFLLFPLLIGILLAVLGYAGAKLKSIKDGTTLRRWVYSMSGGLLMLFSIGVYLIVLLFLVYFSIYSGQ